MPRVATRTPYARAASQSSAPANMPVTVLPLPPLPVPPQLDELPRKPATPPADDPSGRDRRKYVRTLGDAEDAPSAPAIGRIAIRRVAFDAEGRGPIAVPLATPPVGSPVVTQPIAHIAHAPASFQEATRSIRRASDRDRVAELAMEAIDRYVPTCEAAMMLIVRGEVAIGWKGFVRDSDPPPELAVPFEEGSLVLAARANHTARCAAADLAPIDRLLLEALGRSGGDLVVVPVAISDQVPCMIAIATAGDAPVAAVEAVAGAAGAAFARLMRDASR
jgi:hypothetical protein